jgi:transcription antitermination factor NusG
MPYWTAARLLAHRERLALHCLELAGFETYAPRIRERRLVRGRKAWVETALFPLYAFVHIEAGWYDARWAPGISSLVMDGERPGRVPDVAIAELMARERGGFVMLPKPPKAESGFQSGDRLRVRSGPLTGFVGLHAGMAPHDRIVVLLEMFGATRQVELATGDAIKV